MSQSRFASMSQVSRVSHAVSPFFSASSPFRSACAATTDRWETFAATAAAPTDADSAAFTAALPPTSSNILNSNMRTTQPADPSKPAPAPAPSVLTGSASDKAKQKSESDLLTGKSFGIGIAAEDDERQSHLTQNGAGANDSRPPAYNYSRHIEDIKPELLTPGSNPFTIIHNIQDVMRWTVSLIETGEDSYGNKMTMGDKYFLKSGTCDHDKSVPACKGKPRHMYIDNVPSHVVPCSNPSLPSDPKNANAPNGLIAGVVQDIAHINPFEMISSASGSGSIVNDACVLRTEEVGSVSPAYGGLTPNLPTETKCAPAPQPLICSLTANAATSCLEYLPSTNPDVLAYNTKMQGILDTWRDTQPKMTVEPQVYPNKLYATDGDWRNLIPLVDTLFQTKLKATEPTAFLTQKNKCLTNSVTCEYKAVLFEWLEVYAVESSAGAGASASAPASNPSFQVRWEVYFQPTTTKFFVVSAKVCGNSYHSFPNEPDGYFAMTEHFADDATAATTVPASSPHLPVLFSYPFLATLLFVLVILCVGAKCVWGDGWR
jgi:hypothetical protein